MYRNHIHCEDTTQSLLIYTERQQRLCARAATHIRHTHIHCEGTIQLLRTYTSVRRSKSIDFDFLIDLHVSQIHTLRRHDTVFAHIHRTTATSLRTRCNSYTSHTHTHCKGTTQLLRIYTLAWCSKSIGFSVFWSIYMRRKYIDQSLLSSFSWVVIQRTRKFTSKWPAFIYIDQSPPSPLGLMIIQTSRKLTSKWPAFTILGCLCDHLII